MENKNKLHLTKEQFQALRKVKDIDHCKHLIFYHIDSMPVPEVAEIAVEFDNTGLAEEQKFSPEVRVYDWVNGYWIFRPEKQEIVGQGEVEF